MNLDEVFGLDPAMPLVQTDPLMLLACVTASCLAAWFCVLRYRNTYEIEKSIRLYIPFAAVGAAVFTLVGIPMLFAAGAQLCGFVALILISNHYFKK